jgi:hypothetical protein
LNPGGSGRGSTGGDGNWGTWAASGDAEIART